MDLDRSISTLSADELEQEIERGGRCMQYQCCVSLVLITLSFPSGAVLVRAGEGRVMAGIGYSLLSGLFGWWGLPWGPVRTVGAIVTNMRGGIDVTREAMAVVQQQDSTLARLEMTHAQ
jgi:hypothetical protein